MEAEQSLILTMVASKDGTNKLWRTGVLQRIGHLVPASNPAHMMQSVEEAKPSHKGNQERRLNFDDNLKRYLHPKTKLDKSLISHRAC